MDYEKKYKDALELARSYYDKDSMNAFLDTIFPELAESEDERMQKESLHIQELCKENADSFTDEDERIRKAIIHYILYETKWAISKATEHTWVKWLEKQKEEEGYEAIPIESTLEYKAGKHAGFLEGLNEGRKQKEFALTWEDIDKIIQFWMAVLDEMDGTKQELYTKIAELFNESRK